MNLLLDNFDLVAKAPDGIAQLRKLILELAVRGKLVPQDPRDEPASVLLAKIKAEKARPVKEGKIKAGKELPEIGEEEPYKLPVGWLWVKMSEVAQVIRGVTYDKKDASEIQQPGLMPLLRGHNIQFVANTEKLVFVPEALVADEQILQDHDLLVAMSSGSANLVGKATLIVGLKKYSFGAFCGVVRSHHQAVSDYLSWALHSPYYREGIMGSGKGIGINNLQKSALESFLLPLPPLTEQSRIVSRVQELMKVLDTLETRSKESEDSRSRSLLSATRSLPQLRTRGELARDWGRLSANLDSLVKRSEDVKALRSLVLELAVRGRLVAQDPKEEPASELLSKIKAEKARLVKEGKIKAGKEPPEIGEVEKPYELPEGWAWVRLAEITLQITDGTHQTPQYKLSGVPFLSVKDVSSGVLDFGSTKFISDIEHRELTKRCKPEKGDILLTKIGTTGIAVLVNTERSFSIFVSLALLKIPKRGIDGSYLELLLNSPLVRNQSEAGTEGVGNKNLVLRKIENFILCLPPLAEQSRIVFRVQELMKVLDRLEEGLRAQEHVAQGFAEAAAKAG